MWPIFGSTLFEYLPDNSSARYPKKCRVDAPGRPQSEAIMISLMELMSICGVATVTAAGAAQGLQFLRRSRAQRTEQRSVEVNEESSGRPAAGTWHEPRYGKRHPLTCRIEYTVGTDCHDGVIVDMSKRGWRGQGMGPVSRGSVMAVRILCSDPVQDITIDEAVVRWTDGPEFGVEVTRISPDSASRLSDYLIRHYPPEVQTPAYTLSPFSYN